MSWPQHVSRVSDLLRVHRADLNKGGRAYPGSSTQLSPLVQGRVVKVAIAVHRVARLPRPFERVFSQHSPTFVPLLPPRAYLEHPALVWWPHELLCLPRLREQGAINPRSHRHTDQYIRHFRAPTEWRNPLAALHQTNYGRNCVSVW